MMMMMMMMMISQSPLEKKCYGSAVWELHCLRTALYESIRHQAKSEQNVRQDLIPRVRHGKAALCTPKRLTKTISTITNNNKRQNNNNNKNHFMTKGTNLSMTRCVEP